MEKIDLLQEILKHSDDEIIKFLSEKVSDIKRVYTTVESTGEHPEFLFITSSDIELVYDVLKALNRRNAEKYV